MYFRIKQKDGIYYIRWLDEGKHILTDLKEEALVFSFFKALQIIKNSGEAFKLEFWS